jgi:hypothetical protein
MLKEKVLQPEQCALTITSDGHGSVTAEPSGSAFSEGTTIYSEGTTVTLTPVASEGYIFKGWSGPDAASITDNGDGTHLAN